MIKNIIVTLEEDIDFNKMTIDEVGAKLAHFKELYGGTYFQLYIEEVGHFDWRQWDLKGVRKETVAEYDNRLSKDKAKAEKIKLKDMETLKKLQEKYKDEL